MSIYFRWVKHTFSGNCSIKTTVKTRSMSGVTGCPDLANQIQQGVFITIYQDFVNFLEIS